VDAGIYVHGPGEVTTMHTLSIDSADAKEDGVILRLAIATGANAALHYLGEGETVNYATAKEMGEPTARFFTERQGDLTGFLCDLVTAAYRRKAALGLAPALDPAEMDLRVSVTEPARADNLTLAQAAREIVSALGDMIRLGIADRPTAARMAYKFAGEALAEDEIAAILDNAEPVETQDLASPDEPPADGAGEGDE